MTEAVIVERIDIVDGPNLQGLLEAFGADGVSANVFNSVLLDTNGVNVSAEVGRLQASMIAIRYLGNVRPAVKRDFVLTFSTTYGLFEGHYSVHSRKGSLGRLK